MESEDEGIYLRRTEWHSHYRSSEDAEDVPRSEPLRKRNFRARPNGFVRRHQATGSRSSRRRSQALRRILRESPLAGRHLDQLGDATEIDQALEAAESHGRRRSYGRAFQERKGAARARDEAPEPEPAGHRKHGAASRRDVRDRLQRRRNRGQRSATHGRTGGFRRGH